MNHLLYLGLLAGCLLVTLPLELLLGARVYHRPRRLVLTLLPGFVLFTAWDAYAISRHHWRYVAHWVSGGRVGNVPVEELAFFAVIPVCAVLTYEAVGALWRRR